MARTNFLRQPARIEERPFRHLLVEPALDSESYAQLAAYFPSLDLLTNGKSDYGSNQAIRLAARHVIDNPAIAKPWRDFFAFHTSAAFWRQIIETFGAQIRALYPDFEAKIGRPIAEWRTKVRGLEGEADVTLDCLSVVNTPVLAPSSVKPPHVDRSNKLFTGLLYCRVPEDDAGGGISSSIASSARPDSTSTRSPSVASPR